MNFIKIFVVTLLCSAAFAGIAFSQEGVVKTFYPNDTLKSEIKYSNNVKDGPAKYYYPNGKLQKELNYTDGKVDGVVKDYYDNGNVKEIYTIQEGKRNGSVSLFDKDGKYIKDLNYDNGLLVKEEAEDTTANQLAVKNDQSGVGQKELTEKITQLNNQVNNVSAPPASASKQKNNGYLDTADVMPRPVGGIEALLNKLVYPKRAKENEIQGIVKVLAYIDEYGEVSQDEVIQSIGYGCDEAAKITVYYSRFTPGLVNGKPAKVQVIIPIEFKLDKK